MKDKITAFNAPFYRRLFLYVTRKARAEQLRQNGFVFEAVCHAIPECFCSIISTDGLTFFNFSRLLN